MKDEPGLMAVPSRQTPYSYRLRSIAVNAPALGYRAISDRYCNMDTLVLAMNPKMILSLGSVEA